VGPGATAESTSAEEDSAQRQKSERLPVRDLANTEERRQQPVPEQLHHLAADEGDQHNRRDAYWNEEDQFPSHVRFLMIR
jgi:hypothetical protein